MATTKFYLDRRAVRDGGECPLKIVLAHKGKTSLINLNVRIAASQWNGKKGCVARHPRAAFLNAFIARRKADIDMELLKASDEGALAGLDARGVRDAVLRRLDGGAGEAALFRDGFIKFAETRKPNTRVLYMATLRRMEAYDKELGRRSFEDIDYKWLEGFDAFMAKTAPSKNARNIHLRNIRAAFNAAIDEELTKAYPFRRFKIRPAATPKRSLPVERLRQLFSMEVEPHAERYRDLFMLIFFLCGINIVDLCRLKGMTTDGRIEYVRAKTGRLYSVKVEPEALAIINRHRGEGWLLDVLDGYRNYKDFAKRMNRALQLVGKVERRGLGGKKHYEPLFPGITTYWARHSWATIAASLDIPKETIAAALGHGGNTVTDIYIDFDRRKVDEANRRVIDWVLYGKR